LRKGIGRRRKYQEFSGLLLVAGKKSIAVAFGRQSKKTLPIFHF
jgi:hypothetical protein